MKTLAMRWTMAIAAVIFVGCGGTAGSVAGAGDKGSGGTAATGSGTASGTGIVGGLNFTVNDAVVFQFSGPACTGTTQETGAIILLSSAKGLCALAQQPSAALPDSRNLTLVLVNDGQGPQPALTTGTFNVHIGPPMPQFLGQLTQSTNGCTKNNPGYLSGSGTVTITSIDSSGVSGSYNLSFVDRANIANAAGTLSGTFTAPNCAVPAAFYCAQGNSAC